MGNINAKQNNHTATINIMGLWFSLFPNMATKLLAVCLLSHFVQHELDKAKLTGKYICTS